MKLITLLTYNLANRKIRKNTPSQLNDILWTELTHPDIGITIEHEIESFCFLYLEKDLKIRSYSSKDEQRTFNA